MADKEDVMHQSKTIAQWVKDFKGEFTEDQILKLARGGCDLQKILMLGLDEEEKLSPNEGLPGEQHMTFETDENEVNEVSQEDELAAFNESFNDDAITVGDFTKLLARNLAKDSDKLMFRDMDKKAYRVFDMHGKGGTFVVDLVQAIISEEDQIEESITPKWIVDVKAMGMNLSFTSPAETEDKAKQEVLDQIKKLTGNNSSKAEVTSIKPMKEESKTVNEGRNWRNGGYGGYGRSFKSYGEVGAPRGRAISWFNVSELDPKAAGKMMDWRVGPSNFPFKDLLYPERKYKTGTTVLRSKFLKAGDESGVKYIAVPSYLDAVRSNDEAAVELLKALDIPLDLTFGYSPDEDFSMTYTTTK